MKPLVRHALLLLILGLAPLAAPAKDVRFPEKGVPAYAFILPDDWTSSADDYGNLIMTNAGRTSSLVILVGEAPEALDEIARVALDTAKATPFARKEAAEISGCKGFTYFTTMTNANDVKIKAEMTIVRIDAKKFASASLILAEGITKADESTARMVKNGFKLVME